jgi:hypothetical protein
LPTSRSAHSAASLSRRTLAVGLVLAVSVTAAPASAASAASAAPAAGFTTPALPGARSWQSYVLGPASDQVAPIKVESRGDVTRKGSRTTLNTVAGQTPASVLLDFGRDVGGTPYLDIAQTSGPATLSLVTGEARQYLRRPAATTITAAAAGGSSQVTVASAANLEVGNTITIGDQTRVITAVNAPTVDLDRPLDAAAASGAAVTTSPGAPASDESRGLAGVGGPDTLQVTTPGRVEGGFHGGFRFVLLTLTTPGTVTLTGTGVNFQAYRATASDYRGWFLSSDDQLNRMWYSGAYTLQLDMKPAGLNGLPDARIFDGAKRDRSIWTGDLLVQ